MKSVVAVCGADHVSFSNTTSDASGLHQPSNTWTRHTEALFSEFVKNPWTAVGFATVFMDTSDFLFEVIVLQCSSWWTTTEPSVITTSAHLQHFGHLFDRKPFHVISHELEYLPSPLEKMPTAFFKMSRSMRTSASSFRSQSSSLSSAVSFFFPLPGKLPPSKLANSPRHL